MAMNIQKVPREFIIPTNHVYPPGNHVIFEDYFFRRFIQEQPTTSRKYLPILWTNLYISRDYASQDLTDIDDFLASLDRNEKYFTIAQWDDGIINKIENIDILVLSSGGIGSYPIPLNNMSYPKTERTRDIFSSFLGCITGRHKIREVLYDKLHKNNDYLISEKLDFFTFKEVMERSIFSLCPRGYGKTSFRINEALNLGSIPVYVYDDPWVPFGDKISFEEYGILIHESQINVLDNILKSLDDSKIDQLRQRGRQVYEEFYSYPGCYEKSLEVINEK